MQFYVSKQKRLLCLSLSYVAGNVLNNYDSSDCHLHLTDEEI